MGETVATKEQFCFVLLCCIIFAYDSARLLCKIRKIEFVKNLVCLEKNAKEIDIRYELSLLLN